MLEGIAEAARNLPCESAILDGEVVVLDEHGVSNFQRLQGALRGGGAISLVAFDLLHLDGWDLRRASLRDRKATLRSLFVHAPSGIYYGDHVNSGGAEFLREACRAGLEGMVSKRAADPYRSARTRSWLKVKCYRRQELVVVGFTDPGGSRSGLGALHLAVHDRRGSPLRYAGKVATGFDERTLRDLRGRLDELRRRSPSFENAPRGAAARGAHWVEPILVAEISFREWTHEGILRQAIFRGLRDDKDAAEVLVEGVADA
jgi:bifunctional non-homologous end joining protein LigD